MDIELATRLDRIEGMLAALVERQIVKDWCSPGEFARQAGKAECTVRKWCRPDPIRAEKRRSGRGRDRAWVISDQELMQYQRERLRPIARYTRSDYADFALPLARVHRGAVERSFFDEVLAYCISHMRFHNCHTNGIVDEDLITPERDLSHLILYRTSSVRLSSAGMNRCGKRRYTNRRQGLKSGRCA